MIKTLETRTENVIVCQRNTTITCKIFNAKTEKKKTTTQYTIIGWYAKENSISFLFGTQRRKNQHRKLKIKKKIHNFTCFRLIHVYENNIEKKNSDLHTYICLK